MPPLYIPKRGVSEKKGGIIEWRRMLSRDFQIIIQPVL